MSLLLGEIPMQIPQTHSSRPLINSERSVPSNCSACSAGVPADANFCSVCGQPIATEPPRTSLSAALPLPAASVQRVAHDGSQGDPSATAPRPIVVEKLSHSLPAPPPLPTSPAPAQADAQAGAARTIPIVPGAQLCAARGDAIAPAAAPTDAPGSDAGSSLQLIFTVAGQRPCTLPIQPGRFTIGKSGECDIALTADPYISRRHASLVLQDGAVQVEDLGSSNGTFLRLARPIRLEPGDEIVVGTTSFRLRHAPQPTN